MLNTLICYSAADLPGMSTIRPKLEELKLIFHEDLILNPDWLDQRQLLREAIETTEVVILLLSSNSVEKRELAWILNSATTLRKHVVGFVIESCTISDEFDDVSCFYNLSNHESEPRELLRFAGDMIRLMRKDTRPPSNRNPYLNTPSPVDQAGLLPFKLISASELQSVEYKYIMVTVAIPLPDPRTLWSLWPETHKMVEEISRNLTDIDPIVRGVQAGQERIEERIGLLEQRIKSHFDVSMQHFLAPILTRLNEQQAALLDNILNVLDVTTLGANELDCHLSAIEATLTEVQQHAAQISDHQLVQSTAQILAVVRADDLDFKHKLKVTLPIVPFLVDYEGEIELNSQLNLKSAWKALQKLVGR